MTQGSVGLIIEKLSAGYGDARVVQDLSLTIPAGSACLLTGRNGVGKSTLIKAIMAMNTRHSGHVQWQGRDLYRSAKPATHVAHALDTAAIARLGIGYVPEERRIFPDLTVMENLMAGEKSGPGKVWSLADIINLLPPLKPLLNRRGGLLSGGEQQMLSLARSLMGAPSLLLLDEPSEGLAPVLLDHLAAAIAQLRRAPATDNQSDTGLTLMIAEQNWQFASQFTDRVVVMDQGRIVHDDQLERFMADPAAQARLLGAQETDRSE